MTDSSPVPQDKRGFFMLPQMPEESGYYTYGTPFGGRGQYAHVQMLNFIFKLEHGWSCLLYTSPSPRDKRQSRMPSSA